MPECPSAPSTIRSAAGPTRCCPTPPLAPGRSRATSTSSSPREPPRLLTPGPGPPDGRESRGRTAPRVRLARVGGRAHGNTPSPRRPAPRSVASPSPARTAGPAPGDRVRAVLQTRHLLDRHVQLSGQLRVARVAAELGTQPGLAAAQPADPLIHVHRQTDRPRAAVSRPTGDRLADPPGRVGRELEALAPVELLDRAQQPEIALLDQVDQRQAGAGEAPRDRDHQT